MYCPSCGSNNQPEIKFCTRCGTNLSVVSEALTGKFVASPGDETRNAQVMKDYYRGRRDTISGAVLIPAGLLIMAILVGAGMHPIGAFFIIFWMFIWGAAELAGGLGKWIASSAEMKSLGIGSQSRFQVNSSKPAVELQQQNARRLGYSTGPVDAPASATEHTTRQLSEHDYAVASKRESERGE